MDKSEQDRYTCTSFLLKRWMMRTYIWWMAWRQLASRKSKSGLSFMTIVSILGVTIGVAALIIVLSVMGGFESDLVRKMLSGEPNVEIINNYNAGAGFSLKEHPVSEFEKLVPEATALAPFTSADIVLKRKTFLSSATLFGVRPEDEGKKLWAFDGAFLEGSMDDLKEFRKPSHLEETDIPLPGIVLGDQLALQIGADIGDIITVLSPQTNVGSVIGGATIAKQFVMTGKIATGMFNFDARWAMVNINQGRYYLPDFDESLVDDQFVTGIGMNVKDPFKVDSLTQRIEASKQFKAQSWQTTNKALLFALRLEKFTMGSILMLIVLVAAFSISGTMMMTVYHKRHQVSVLCALGMSRREITKLFLSHGFAIGTVGITFGLMLGLAVCSFIYQFKNIPLPQGVYYLKSLPVRFLPVEYTVICGLTWVFCLLASAYPAYSAAKQEPSNGLRYD